MISEDSFYIWSYSENTKNVLIAASYIHLKHKEQVKYTSELSTINPRILLSGPAGKSLSLASFDEKLLMNCVS